MMKTHHASYVAASIVIAACRGDDRNASEPESILPDGCIDATDAPPDDLKCTGLFARGDIASIAVRARAYAPAVSFWTDGAEKRRWIDLPDAPIDGTNEDGWRFPVGTKVWKEMSFGGRRIETRYFRKVRDDRWLSAAYLWSEDGLRARRTDGADVSVGTTTHHVPSPSECSECHDGKADRLLGFEMVSLGLSGASGLNLSALAAENKIVPPPRVVTMTLPSDAEALGWMHVNCGTSCHNESSLATAYPTGLALDIKVDELVARPIESWRARTNTIGVGARTPRWQSRQRVVAGDPAASLIVTLARSRGEEQMPPIATNVVDEAGVTSVERWIESLSRP
jgi:hypothetical protein